MPHDTHRDAHSDSAEHVTELTLAQAQAFTPSPVAPAAPAVEPQQYGRCAPFCGEKEYHAADPQADDGTCRSDDMSTALNITPWAAGFPVIADVRTFRASVVAEPIVWLSLRSTGHYDGTEVQLTADEARRIARHLLTAADLTEEL
ncbi:hypothetical protein REK76_00990 [Nocardia farcinica]|uniref:hypothetical protein n=1 Tax=Nocardia farcinica TaxID=37329 RepID=UPI00311F5E9C